MPLSLVSYYGDKPKELAQLIARLQGQLSTALGPAFRPYAVAQVHGTIMGLETIVKDKQLYSEWFVKNRGAEQPVDLDGFLTYLRKSVDSFPIKIGGYTPTTDYGFKSRGQHPYLRSFSLQGNRAVAMGWPSTRDQQNHSTALFDLRQDFEAFNWCHKWNKDGYQDNDFFFVLGKLDRHWIGEETVEQLSQSLQKILASTPLYLPIQREVLSIVAYVDTELPLASSRRFGIDSSDFSAEHLRMHMVNE